jgi:tetratricopeptide (TPR) repeat protein
LKKQQLILLGSAVVIMAGIFLFGKTVPPPSVQQRPVAEGHAGSGNSTAPGMALSVSTDTLLAAARQHLKPEQAQQLLLLEKALPTAASAKALSDFWKGIHHHELTLYYLGESAKLENSEKSLTFAAHLFLNNMMEEHDGPLQHWYAARSKELFEKALAVNPNNDSSRIGLGATYMFGHVSDNPMQGILPIREIAEKHPDNLYAQMMLGLGGIQSGQYQKAVDRFLIIVQKQPDNLEAIFHLAETYDRMGDKANAVKWYEAIVKKIPSEEVKKELTQRIKALQ